MHRHGFKVLKDQVSSLLISQLTPDHAVVNAAPGMQTWALREGQTHWLIYCETLATHPYLLSLNLPKGTYAVEWIDVKTGKVIQQGKQTTGQLQPPPGVADRVAVVRKL